MWPHHALLTNTILLANVLQGNPLQMPSQGIRLGKLTLTRSQLLAGAVSLAASVWIYDYLYETHHDRQLAASLKTQRRSG